MSKVEHLEIGSLDFAEGFKNKESPPSCNISNSEINSALETYAFEPNLAEELVKKLQGLYCDLDQQISALSGQEKTEAMAQFLRFTESNQTKIAEIIRELILCPLSFQLDQANGIVTLETPDKNGKKDEIVKRILLQRDEEIDALKRKLEESEVKFDDIQLSMDIMSRRQAQMVSHEFALKQANTDLQRKARIFEQELSKYSKMSEKKEATSVQVPLFVIAPAPEQLQTPCLPTMKEGGRVYKFEDDVIQASLNTAATNGKVKEEECEDNSPATREEVHTKTTDELVNFDSEAVEDTNREKTQETESAPAEIVSMTNLPDTQDTPGLSGAEENVNSTPETQDGAKESAIVPETVEEKITSIPLQENAPISTVNEASAPSTQTSKKETATVAPLKSPKQATTIAFTKAVTSHGQVLSSKPTHTSRKGLKAQGSKLSHLRDNNSDDLSEVQPVAGTGAKSDNVNEVESTGLSYYLGRDVSDYNAGMIGLCIKSSLVLCHLLLHVSITQLIAIFLAATIMLFKLGTFLAPDLTEKLIPKQSKSHSLVRRVLDGGVNNSLYFFGVYLACRFFKRDVSLVSLLFSTIIELVTLWTSQMNASEAIRKVGQFALSLVLVVLTNYCLYTINNLELIIKKDLLKFMMNSIVGTLAILAIPTQKKTLQTINGVKNMLGFGLLLTWSYNFY